MFFTVTWTLLIILLRRDCHKPWDCGESAYMVNLSKDLMSCTDHPLFVPGPAHGEVPHSPNVRLSPLAPSFPLLLNQCDSRRWERLVSRYLRWEFRPADFPSSSNGGIMWKCPDNLRGVRWRIRWLNKNRAPSSTSTGSWNLSKAPFFSLRFRKVILPWTPLSFQPYAKLVRFYLALFHSSLEWDQDSRRRVRECDWIAKWDVSHWLKAR